MTDYPKYNDSYPVCADTYATLCLYHEDLNPEDINCLLDLQCTWSCQKGDPIYEKEPERAKRKKGAWLLRTEGKIDSKDSRRHVDWLLDQVEDKSKALKRLEDMGYEIRISCFWVSKHGHGAQSSQLKNVKD